MLQHRLTFFKVLWIYRDGLKYIFVFFMPSVLISLVINPFVELKYHYVAGMIFLLTGVIMLYTFLKNNVSVMSRMVTQNIVMPHKFWVMYERLIGCKLVLLGLFCFGWGETVNVNVWKDHVFTLVLIGMFGHIIELYVALVIVKLRPNS